MSREGQGGGGGEEGSSAHTRTQPASPAGAYIQSRFTQKDLRQRAVLYVIPPDQEVTSDSFQFRLSDPAGNSAAPET